MCKPSILGYLHLWKPSISWYCISYSIHGFPFFTYGLWGLVIHGWSGWPCWSTIFPVNPSTSRAMVIAVMAPAILKSDEVKVQTFCMFVMAGHGFFSARLQPSITNVISNKRLPFSDLSRSVVGWNTANHKSNWGPEFWWAMRMLLSGT